MNTTQTNNTEKNTLESRIIKAQEVAKELGLIYTGHIINIGVSYFSFEYSSYVGWIYEPDMDYIYDLVFGLNTCSEYSLERRQRNLESEFKKSGIFLVGEIKIRLPNTKSKEALNK